MELFYATGGHGGPYESQVDARDAAIKMLAAELPLYPLGHNIQIRTDSTTDRVERWINVEDVEQLGRSYRDALTVQSACNLSGVVYSFERAMKALCALGFDTAERNEHPISVLFATQIAHLSKCEQGDRYHKAYEEAKKYEVKSGKPDPSVYFPKCGEVGTLTLEDDGTMDTVVSCDVCGMTERFNDIERDESGPTSDAFRYMEEAHTDKTEYEDACPHCQRSHGARAGCASD